ncbi:crossover junction endodeoxyribonuclease RuvC [Candidatus Poribacteria bacterium]|nr:crossover junction endodeoxyribonuclease RuvC [Candidatus Poribacteria bacterium]
MRYKTNALRCLGIDPGIANTGYAVVVRSARGYQLVTDGLIKTQPSEPTPERLLTIYKVLCEIVDCELPDILAIESCYHNKNISSSMKTGGVIGVVQLIAAQYGCEASEFTPQQVKASSGLGGTADKKAVQRMMSKIFRKRTLNHHIADAAACAIAGLLQ